LGQSGGCVFIRRRATNDHIRLLASYDLRQLVYVSAVILAAAAIYVGVLMARSDEAGHRITLSNQGGLLGGMLVVFGTILIMLVGMATLGPWREHTPGVFPIHIIDLQSPISEPERNALKRSNP
jgi:hypothetical protein